MKKRSTIVKRVTNLFLASMTILVLAQNPAHAADSMVSSAAGNKHSLALKEDGTVWAWGDNTSGQLGDGTTVRKNVLRFW